MNNKQKPNTKLWAWALLFAAIGVLCGVLAALLPLLIY